MTALLTHTGRELAERMMRRALRATILGDLTGVEVDAYPDGGPGRYAVVYRAIDAASRHARGGIATFNDLERAAEHFEAELLDAGIAPRGVWDLDAPEPLPSEPLLRPLLRAVVSWERR